MITSHAIEVDDVTVRYGRILALDHASVRVPTGRICALVGMNGSGKSTLFKTIVGSVTPTPARSRSPADPLPPHANPASSGTSRSPRTSTGRSRSPCATS